MSLSLSPDVEQFVTKKVGSGQYATKDEAVNAIVLIVNYFLTWMTIIF
jgi:hypothetical protein